MQMDEPCTNNLESDCEGAIPNYHDQSIFCASNRFVGEGQTNTDTATMSCVTVTGSNPIKYTISYMSHIHNSSILI